MVGVSLVGVVGDMRVGACLWRRLVRVVGLGLAMVNGWRRLDVRGSSKTGVGVEVGEVRCRMVIIHSAG